MVDAYQEVVNKLCKIHEDNVEKCSEIMNILAMEDAKCGGRDNSAVWRMLKSLITFDPTFKSYSEKLIPFRPAPMLCRVMEMDPDSTKISRSSKDSAERGAVAVSTNLQQKTRRYDDGPMPKHPSPHPEAEIRTTTPSVSSTYEELSPIFPDPTAMNLADEIYHDINGTTFGIKSSVHEALLHSTRTESDMWPSFLEILLLNWFGMIPPKRVFLSDKNFVPTSLFISLRSVLVESCSIRLEDVPWFLDLLSKKIPPMMEKIRKRTTMRTSRMKRKLDQNPSPNAEAEMRTIKPETYEEF